MLVQAARQVIAERGLHATTLRDVAAAGEVAVGTVTYHFSGIAEVLAEVLRAEMRDYSEPIMASAAAAPEGREALRHMVSGLLADGRRARDHWRLWLDFWALSVHESAYAQWQREIYAQLHALVQRGYLAGYADGSLPCPAGVTPAAAGADSGRATAAADAAAREAAVRFVALMDGLVVQCYLPQAVISPATARELLLTALFPPSRPSLPASRPPEPSRPAPTGVPGGPTDRA
nr:TetR family transcriptional regulator C-terminal domain-containing protein [Nakamurella aerolata]